MTSMTYNETKILHWKSETSRANGELWSGELDIDDLTEMNSMVTSEPTLTCALFEGSMVQVTPSGVYINGIVAKQLRVDERIVQADISGSDLVLVVYRESGEWQLSHIIFVPGTASEAAVSLSDGEEIQLAREASVVKILTYRYCLIIF